MRAAHTRLDPHPLIDDPWGDRLVPESVKRALASSNAMLDETLLRSRSYPNVVMRTRYAEDALKAGVSSGIRQYVLIGAGFDSFSLRRPCVCRESADFRDRLPRHAETEDRANRCVRNSIARFRALHRGRSIARERCRRACAFAVRDESIVVFLVARCNDVSDPRGQSRDLEIDCLLQPGGERGGFHLPR